MAGEAAGSGGGATAAVAGAGEPSVATVERRGIEYVPVGSRWGTPGNLFWLWAGAVWNVEFLI